MSGRPLVIPAGYTHPSILLRYTSSYLRRYRLDVRKKTGEGERCGLHEIKNRVKTRIYGKVVGVLDMGTVKQPSVNIKDRNSDI